MKTPSITSGIQTEGSYTYPYVGLSLGKYEYRIYEDREGWFVSGDFTAIPPKGSSANRIRQALHQAGKGSFLDYLAGALEKWKLKELAGV
jgi:hypothetical protein